MPLEEQDWVDPIVDAVVDHMLKSGHFRQVNRHEPSTPQIENPSASVFWQSIRASRRASGLASTAAHLVLTIRIYGNVISQPEDEVDPLLGKAALYLVNAFNGDFDLAENVRNIDIFGEEGDPLESNAGYIGFGNPPILQRVQTITLPLIVNDVWVQGDS
jgi:hypothetical protein